MKRRAVDISNYADNVIPVDEGNAAGVDNQRQHPVAVTPALTTTTTTAVVAVKNRSSNVRRTLFPEQPTTAAGGVAVTPSRTATTTAISTREGIITPSPAKRKLLFGRYVDEIEVRDKIEVNDNVHQVYRIVNKLTGSIGGNGSFGPIYGELTKGSMQKMINLMKDYTQFNTSSRFIDVGSGIGKPNLHVAQDPGVAVSYGIEVELNRWLLGMNCLKGVLDTILPMTTEHSSSHDGGGGGGDGTYDDEMDAILLTDPERLRCNCIFVHGDITEATTLDPFTHVYMFSIGFPPKLWEQLSTMWNRSVSPYLICFHGPKHIIHKYNFNVELLVQTPTSMYGSSEGHMGYIYKRNDTAGSTSQRNHAVRAVPRLAATGDPYYAASIDIVNSGLEHIRAYVTATVKEHMESSRRTRSQKHR